jgi:hypothetical protein
MGQVKASMPQIYLNNTRKFSPCLAVNTLLFFTKTSWLMLFIEIIADYFCSHRKVMNILYRKNSRFLSLEAGDTVTTEF